MPLFEFSTVCLSHHPSRFHCMLPNLPLSPRNRRCYPVPMNGLKIPLCTTFSIGEHIRWFTKLEPNQRRRHSSPTGEPTPMRSGNVFNLQPFRPISLRASRCTLPPPSTSSRRSSYSFRLIHMQIRFLVVLHSFCSPARFLSPDL